MEVFLLWMDELDDAAVALWTLLPRVLGFVAALAALVATGFACLRLPAVAAPSVLLLLASSLLYRARRPAPPGGFLPSA
jgi:hypothetical protein